MYKSPNGNQSIKRNQRDNYFAMGNNNLSVRFKKALSILLSTEYYEGSRYGKVYNKTGPNGKSKIYVDQPEMEERFCEQFINLEDDAVKFLVGPTGVGKTTLIRNMFHVFDRDVVVTDNNLVIYVSFYSMISYFEKDTESNRVVQDALLGAINAAISYLDNSNYVDRLSGYTDDYYEKFYDFIYENNKILIESFRNTSENVEKMKKENGKKVILDWLVINKPVDYHMCQLKYYLNLYKERTNQMFNNVILILDDIESMDSQYADSILECAYHCKKCMQANAGREYYFKALVSMRNYSYRIQQIRRKEAFREIPWNDVIMKDIVPGLSDVLDKRARYVLDLDEVVNLVENREAFQEASNKLQIILQRMYGQYDKMILSLTHNNIFKSMTLLLRIITNKSHFGKYEIDRFKHKGAFSILARDYSIENSSDNSEIPGNDAVYYALVYGEQRVYFDNEDYYLTNIMHYKYREGVDTEIFGIYIIQYFIKAGVSLQDPSYDGFESILSTKVIADIMGLYSFPTATQTQSTYDGLRFMMEHLYKGGVLLQSIIEPIKEDSESVNRVYIPEMKVYLSLRGGQLYKMLSYNSLLFATYRDDIDTNINNNDVATLDMTMDERMFYCLEYIDYLSDKEISLLRRVSDYRNYILTMGSELVVIILMKGMEETIRVYYTNETPAKQRIVEKYNSIESEVNNFLDEIHKESNVMFTKIISI